MYGEEKRVNTSLDNMMAERDRPVAGGPLPGLPRPPGAPTLAAIAVGMHEALLESRNRLLGVLDALGVPAVPTVACNEKSQAQGLQGQLFSLAQLSLEMRDMTQRLQAHVGG